MRSSGQEAQTPAQGDICQWQTASEGQLAWRISGTDFKMTGRYTKITIFNGKITIFNGKITMFNGKMTIIAGVYPLVMTNSSPWFFDGPNRNRWFTELKNAW
jgi:hypothetical protein